MESLEKALARPVFNHELANPDALIKELNQEAPAPSIKEIFAMIPVEKALFLRTTIQTNDQQEK